MNGTSVSTHERRWYESADIMLKVFSFLKNVDFLSCDQVCKYWKQLQAPLPQPVRLAAAVASHDIWLAWLRCNIGRIHGLTLVGYDTTQSSRNDARLWSLLCDPCGATLLEALTLQQCNHLVSLPTCIGNLQALKKLCLVDCRHIQCLPSSVGKLTALEHLEITTGASYQACSASYCSASHDARNDGMPVQLSVLCDLVTLPDSIGELALLQHLILQGCNQLQGLPETIDGCCSLTQLVIDVADNEQPEYHPYTLHPHSNLTRLPSSISHLPSLQYLKLRGCNALQSLPDSLGNLRALTRLELCGCHSLESLPLSFGQLGSLGALVIDGTNSLLRLPDCLGLLNSLTCISISYCHKLENIPCSVGDLKQLQVLNIGCHGLVDSLPDSLGQLQALQKLSIDCGSLMAIPESISQLTDVTELSISHCLCMQSLPEGIGHLQGLKLLLIDTCPNVPKLPCTITALHHLEELLLLNNQEYGTLPALPHQLGNLTSLRRLVMCSTAEDQMHFPSLPGSVGLLRNLTELQVGHMHLFKRDTLSENLVGPRQEQR